MKQTVTPYIIETILHTNGSWGSPCEPLQPAIEKVEDTLNTFIGHSQLLSQKQVIQEPLLFD